MIRRTTDAARGAGSDAVGVGTKVERPRTREAYPLRPRLLKPRRLATYVQRPRLDAGLNRERPGAVTTVVAPSGYGKSTLVAEWLEGRPGRGVWLTLDETDDSREGMTRAIVAAAQTVVPGAGRVASTMLAMAAADGVGWAIASDLGGGEGPITLVLDDLHRVRTPDALAVVAGMVAAAQPRLHIVLISRDTPPIALAGRDRLTAMTQRDLMFTGDEILELAGLLGCPRFDQADAAKVFGLTAGWPTMVRLIVARWQEGPPGMALDSDPTVAKGLQELVAQTLASLRAADVAALEWASLGETMCDELLQAIHPADLAVSPLSVVAGRYGALPVTETDGPGGWFRIPPLVRSELQHRLRERWVPKAVRDGERRGAEWLVDHGYVEDAVRIAVAAEDVDAAVQYVVDAGFAHITQQVTALVGALVELLPAEIVEARPELLTLRALAASRDQLAGVATANVEAARRLLASEGVAGSLRVPRRRLEPLLDLVEIDTTYAPEDIDGLLARYRSVLAALSAEDAFARGMLTMSIAMRVAPRRGAEAAVALIGERLASLPAGHEVERTYHEAGLAVAHAFFTGDRWRELTHLRATLELATAQALAAPRAFAGTGLGWDALHRLDLAAAEAYFAAVAALPEAMGFTTWCAERQGAALTAALLGREAEANAIARQTVEAVERSGATTLLDTARSFQVRLSLLHRTYAPVDRWLEDVAVEPFHETPMANDVAGLTAIRALLSLREAAIDTRAIDPRIAAGIAALQRTAATFANDRTRDALAVARALVASAMGEDASGLLAPIVDRAAAFDDLLVFAEHGGAMIPLLERLAIGHGQGAFITRAIEACRRVDAIHPHRPASRSLTDREVAILEALAGRRERREIAAELFISDRTVQRHSMTIYRKLGVNSRAEAVERARAQGRLRETDPGR